MSVDSTPSAESFENESVEKGTEYYQALAWWITPEQGWQEGKNIVSHGDSMIIHIIREHQMCIEILIDDSAVYPAGGNSDCKSGDDEISVHNIEPGEHEVKITYRKGSAIDAHCYGRPKLVEEDVRDQGGESTEPIGVTIKLDVEEVCEDKVFYSKPVKVRVQ